MNFTEHTILQRLDRSTWTRRVAVGVAIVATAAITWTAFRHLSAPELVRAPKPYPTIDLVELPRPKPVPVPNKPEPQKIPPKATDRPVPNDPPPATTQPPGASVKANEPASDSGWEQLGSGAVTHENDVPDTIGGAGRDTYAWYGATLQRQVQSYLLTHPELQGTEFNVTLRIWLNEHGGISRVEIRGGSDNSHAGELLRLALQHMPALGERPPKDMPQPVRLRVKSRA